MARGQAIRQVSASARSTWAVLSDHAGMAGWGPGLTVELERPGAPTANGIGAIRAIRGPAVHIREQVTAFEPDRLLAYRALSGVPLPDYAGEVELAERAGRTSVRWTITSSSRLPGVDLALRAIAAVLLRALARAVAKHDRHAN